MKSFEFIVQKSLFSAAAASVFITIGIFCFMIFMGLPVLGEGHLFDLITRPWLPGEKIFGIYPMILGSLTISSLAMGIALPLSLGCAALISVISPTALGRVMKGMVSVMTGIPTVIYGFIGIFLLVPLVRNVFSEGSGLCILSAALLLALLVSPTMILLFSKTFDSVPDSYLKAADALGCTRVQKLIYVVLPNSIQRMATGFLLSAGRTMGDTMIALMVAGNAVAIPGAITDSARTLTAHIALLTAADFNSMAFKTLFVCGMLLYLFTLTLTLAATFITAQKNKT